MDGKVDAQGKKAWKEGCCQWVMPVRIWLLMPDWMAGQGSPVLGAEEGRSCRR